MGLAHCPSVLQPGTHPPLPLPRASPAGPPVSLRPPLTPWPPVCWQKLQQELEFLEVQEEYIKDEQKNLKKEFLHAQEEVKRIQSIPLVIGQFLEAVDQNTAIVGSTTGGSRRGASLPGPWSLGAVSL